MQNSSLWGRPPGELEAEQAACGVPEGQQHLGLAVSGVFRPEKGAPSLCKALAQQPSNPLPSQRPRPEGPRPAGCSDSSEIGLQITPRVLPKWRVVDVFFECTDERADGTVGWKS